jgi:hypothetical protein
MAIAMLHDQDPRDLIRKIIGDLSTYEIGPRQILGAIYLRPEKTKGGIALPKQNLEEDFYQSKSCLAVRVGEGATFCGSPVREGDWLVVRPSDCVALEVNGVRCRHIFDDRIMARIPQPWMVW